MTKKNFFQKVLSIISYKKQVENHSFVIPEINEGMDIEGKKIFHIKESDNSDKECSDNFEGKDVKKPVSVTSRERKKPEKNEKGNREKDNGNEDKKSISTDYDTNIEFLKRAFNAEKNKDIVIREFNAGGKYKAFIAYLDGMADKATIDDFILRPLLKRNNYEEDRDCTLEYILKNILEASQTEKVDKKDDAIYSILVGNTILYVEGCDFYISSETKGFERRGVEKPQTEGVVRGSQEAFNENLRTNITLIRRIIKNKSLTTEFIKIGERNKNLCAVVYINGLTNPAIVNEVKRRVSSLKTDFINGSGMLEQFIEENPWSIVPTILTTERPDRASSHIMEGKVVIIAEGTPFALVVPVSLSTMFHTPEDTSLRWQYGTLLRIVRIIAVFVATLIPGLYVALTNFDREMIPTDLLIAIAKARENVPFPTIVEVLVMEISFELIREAGIRIPGIIGNTIGIIGALILGQAAVQANLVSPVLIIVIAITGLGNFAIPDFSMAFAARITRLFFIALGAFIGFYGISLGLVTLITLLANTKSFGVPLLSFYAPKVKGGGDLIIRKPLWMQEFRPDNVNPLDVRRQPKISRQWLYKKNKNVKKHNRKEDADE